MKDIVAHREVYFSHASIDRLYALWQEKNLTALYQENTTTDSTIDSPLLPFSRAEPFAPWKSRMMQRALAGDPIPKCVVIQASTALTQC